MMRSKDQMMKKIIFSHTKRRREGEGDDQRAYEILLKYSREEQKEENSFECS
mgnify:CR=1 FL=1